MATSCAAAAAIVLAASAACGLDLNASDDGEYGSSNPGNGVPLFEHVLLSKVTASAIMVDNSRSVDDIKGYCLVIMKTTGAGRHLDIVLGQPT